MEIDYRPVLEKCLKGEVPEGLKELYYMPTRDKVDWSLFPYWARPDDPVEGCHEG